VTYKVNECSARGFAVLETVRQASKLACLRRFAARASAAFLVVSMSAALSAADPLPSPLDTFGSDAARAFTEPMPLILYGAAFVSTAALAPTGADHAVRVAVQEHIQAPVWADGAYYGGYVLPLTIAPGLYVSGLIADSRSLSGAGSAAVQALALTFATTVVLKVAVGRAYPLNAGDPNAPDRLNHPEYATDFSPFGFHGRYAWPSGHTSAAVSVAASLTAFSDSIVVPLIAYPVAAGIGFGMIVADRHWTSDVVAGACIGQAMGWTVGRAFRERMTGTHGNGVRVYLVPLTGEVTGLGLSGVL